MEGDLQGAFFYTLSSGSETRIPNVGHVQRVQIASSNGRPFVGRAYEPLVVIEIPFARLKRLYSSQGKQKCEAIFTRIESQWSRRRRRLWKEWMQSIF